MKERLRIGTGIDFHRLLEDRSRPLMLGGYLIQSDLALAGHSDADVLLHALADAILGALAEGDIGDAFPDTDARYQNMDSSRILGHALSRMKDRGFLLGNVDITVIGEKPKIKPHRQEIRERLAELTGLGLDAIGLKATTTEKMGALGRSEGLGCLATVLLLGKD